jgi:polyisoprenoid-binding protein YceI
MTTTTATQIPTGTWTVDPVHSTALFSVEHAAVGTFRGQFRKIDGGLENGALRGEVSLDSLDVFDDNLKGHLLSPDFFDAEQNPALTFVSTAVRPDGDDVIVEGELTVRGVTKAVEAKGRLTEPFDLGEMGGVKFGADLETTVNRTEFGLNWNAPLAGGKRMLGDDVTLSVHLELVQAQA